MVLDLIHSWQFKTVLTIQTRTAVVYFPQDLLPRLQPVHLTSKLRSHKFLIEGGELTVQVRVAVWASTEIVNLLSITMSKISRRLLKIWMQLRSLRTLCTLWTAERISTQTLLALTADQVNSSLASNSSPKVLIKQAIARWSWPSKWCQILWSITITICQGSITNRTSSIIHKLLLLMMVQIHRGFWWNVRILMLLLIPWTTLLKSQATNKQLRTDLLKF